MGAGSVVVTSTVELATVNAGSSDTVDVQVDGDDERQRQVEHSGEYR